MEKKFYMITINKEDNLFANVYDQFNDFVKSSKELSKKYPIKIWELRQTSEDNFDLVITKEDNKYVVCLRPKTDITDKKFIKCFKREMNIHEIK